MLPRFPSQTHHQCEQPLGTSRTRCTGGEGVTRRLAGQNLSSGVVACSAPRPATRSPAPPILRPCSPSSQGAQQPRRPPRVAPCTARGSGRQCRTRAPYSPYSAITLLPSQRFSRFRHLALRFWNQTWWGRGGGGDREARRGGRGGRGGEGKEGAQDTQ